MCVYIYSFVPNTPKWDNGSDLTSPYQYRVTSELEDGVG